MFVMKNLYDTMILYKIKKKHFIPSISAISESSSLAKSLNILSIAPLSTYILEIIILYYYCNNIMIVRNS